MRLSRDPEGLESLPLRLLIVAAVAAMSVAPAAEALDTLQDRDFLTRAGLTLDKVVHVAQMLSMQGPGAARTVDVDLSSEGGLRAVRLVIGDCPDGPRRYAVVLELSSGAVLTRSAEDPPACMTSLLCASLETRSTELSLRMQAQVIDGGCVVLVEVV